jgi:HlyD family secretion protein
MQRQHRSPDIMRRFLALLLLIALGGAGWWYAAGGGGSRADTAQAWRVAVVDRGSIVAAVNATGTINPTATAIVGSQVSGQVVEVLADYNSPVKAGQVLARLNAEQVQARLDAARADLAQARAVNRVQRATVEKVSAEIERARASRTDAEANRAKSEALLADAGRTLARQTELRERGISTGVALQQAETQLATASASRDQADAQIRVSEAQRRSLEADLKVAEAQILSSEAQVAQREAIVRQIEVDIRNSEIRSPVDGVVVQRNIELGQTVAASLQAPTLFLVAQDLSRIEIYANIDEADVGRVREGMEATFTVTAYPGREFRGRLKTVRLGSQTLQNVVIYTAVIEVENGGLELKPGMTATIRVFTERRENVLRVANAALRWRPSGEAPVATVASAPASAPAEPANPFEGGPGGGRGGGQGGAGQGGGQGMLDRLARELELTPAQREQVRAALREARQGNEGPADTPEARRERARAVRAALDERLAPLLDERQRGLLAALRQQRPGGGGPPAQGLPGRLYVEGPDGKPAVKIVRLGATDGSFTEIVSGAEAGTRAIIGGGPRVTPRPGGPRMGF